MAPSKLLTDSYFCPVIVTGAVTIFADSLIFEIIVMGSVISPVKSLINKLSEAKTPIIQATLSVLDKHSTSQPKHRLFDEFFWRALNPSKCVTEILMARKSYSWEHDACRSRYKFWLCMDLWSNFDGKSVKKVLHKFWQTSPIQIIGRFWFLSAIVTGPVPISVRFSVQSFILMDPVKNSFKIFNKWR